MTIIDRPEHCPDPVRRAVMRQEWKDLGYLHWRYDPATVQDLLPQGVNVDTFDGSAWVGLIPFSMRDIGFAKGPSVPYLGSFAEVNVRTYVQIDGRPGVWFFSLDVDRLLPAVVARVSYRLPYCWGATSHLRHDDVLSTHIRRRWPQSVPPSTIMMRMGPHVVADELDIFLTARWGLYSSSRAGVRYAAVEHEPWPLRHADVLSYDTVLLEAAGLPTPSTAPVARCSDGVHVRIGPPRSVALPN